MEMDAIDLKTRYATQYALSELRAARLLAASMRSSADGMVGEAGAAIIECLNNVRRLIKGYPHNPGDTCSFCGHIERAPEDS